MRGKQNTNIRRSCDYDDKRADLLPVYVVDRSVLNWKPDVGDSSNREVQQPRVLQELTIVYQDSPKNQLQIPIRLEWINDLTAS